MNDRPIRVLVSDKLAQDGLEILEAEPGLEVTVNTGLAPEDLKKELAKHDAIIVRSATKLPAEVLSAAPELRAIVRAGVGVDNVDVDAATRQGTLVMNTPGGNTISTAELAVALLLALCRNIAPACAKLKAGTWDKKSFQGVELNGKTIGILGLGRIGCEVAKRCRAFNMRVLGYDPFLSEERAEQLGITVCKSVDELVPQVDFLTVHTPLNDDTRGIIGAAEFARMKDGVRVVNGARGGIIDEQALFEALESGKVAGAALDVYTVEPPEDRRLVEHDRVLCTPHLGASTKEAQVGVAVDAARQLIDALKNGEVRSALNYPALSRQEATELAPYGELALRLGRLAGQLVEGQLEVVSVTYAGEIADRDLRGVTNELTTGLMRCFEEDVNPVNAPMLARQRGIDIRVTTTETARDFRALLRVEAQATGGAHTFEGTILGRRSPWLVMIDDFRLELPPEGTLLLIRNVDRPGVVGAVGTVLGDARINISGISWGSRRGQALSLVRCDADTIAPDILRTLEKLPDVKNVRMVRV